MKAQKQRSLKRHLREKRMMKVKYLLVCALGKKSRAKWLKDNDVFASMGENVLFQPTKLPNEPKLIKLHNNVRIASNVTFYTHDVINTVFSYMDKQNYNTHGSCIEIHDKIFIGGNTTIVGGVSIGPNAIVAAGSCIVKDVQPGTIVGGNPARVIGDFFELKRKRIEEDGIGDQFDPNGRAEELWDKFYRNH